MALLIWSAVGLVIKMQLSGLCRGRRKRKKKGLGTYREGVARVCQSADTVVLPHEAAQVLVKRCVSCYVRQGHTSARIPL